MSTIYRYPNVQTEPANHHGRLYELPEQATPRARLRDVGATALADAELLALILYQGSDTLNVLKLSQRLLSEQKGWNGLLRADLDSLREYPGIGVAKASAIIAALEIARRLLLASYTPRLQIRSPGDIAQLLMLEMGHLDQEHLRTVLLDTRNYVQEISTIYIGSLNTSVIRIGEVFRQAVKRNSASLIVVHNHPSGDPSPSPEDVLVTKRIINAGTLLDCEVLDHIIIGQGRFVSLRERGLGFSKE